jgi:hypothetical protein
MKLLLVIASVVLLFSACSRPLAPQSSRSGDPIERLMMQVPFEDCPSYLYVPVDLSTNSAPTEVIEALSKRGTLRDNRITRFKVLEIRSVHSSQEGARDCYYSAIVLDTNLGRKIALLQPQSGGWYYKIYDAQ